MSFRRRIALVSAAAVAIAVVLASLLTYALVSEQLHSQVDTQLGNRGREAGGLVRFLDQGARSTAAGARGAVSPLPPLVSLDALSRSLPGGAAGSVPRASQLFGRLSPLPNQVRGYQQVIDAHGTILLRSARGISLPVDAATRALAARGGQPQRRDAHVQGLHLRVLAEPFGKGRALQLAQPLTEVDSLLSRLRLILVLLDIGGIALAALLGTLVAGAAVRPLRHLIDATEHVTVTRDLSRRIEPVGDDEIGRLASSFNAMLDALEGSMRALDASVDAQRQLVADASHELRTPVTSLRTNVEILQQRGADMDVSEQQQLLGDVVEQIEELTMLMNDLIELARGEEPHGDAEDVRLDVLVSEVAERTRRRSPQTPLELALEPTLIAGVAARLERAVGNLIDNAVKYSPPGAPVEVTLDGSELTVRDRGPGIAEEDAPHVFDRFYRGAEARGRPGSGLGLAIVRQVAGEQGGSVSAERAPGGGTLMRLRLPGMESMRLEDEPGEPTDLDGPPQPPYRSATRSAAAP
jgi:two-component system sensor histidine kinase MprB